MHNVSRYMRMNWIKKIAAVVIFLNLLELNYLFFRPTIQRGFYSSPNDPYSTSIRIWSSEFKPWPRVISFQPWTVDPDKSPPFSCEAYFGNGFTQVFTDLEEKGISMLNRKQRAGKNETRGSFKCHYSETMQTSICEGTNLVMHPDKIEMSVGGEDLEQVIGRNEEEELPTFSVGAFEMMVSENEINEVSNLVVSQNILDKLIPQGQVRSHTLRSAVQSMRKVAANRARCTEVVAGPTLFVTRFEYANLFHTTTDWYSAYASARVVGLEKRPRIVMLDGHCKSPMDDGWEAFFSGVTYAKHFSGSICFEHAIFVPLGYDTAFFKSLGGGLPCQGVTATESYDTHKTARLREFGETFAAALGATSDLPLGGSLEERGRHHQILFIRRENYLAHPRHSGKPESRLSNEEELLKSLQNWAVRFNSRSSGIRNITIFNGLFAHKDLTQQVKAVQASSVILGVHGAGLTHITFARPGTVVLEILSPLFIRPHYQYISQWMGLEYQSIHMDDTTVDPNDVLKELDQIFT